MEQLTKNCVKKKIKQRYFHLEKNMKIASVRAFEV